MVADVVQHLPAWLLAGVLLGAVATAGVAVVFALGNRLAPTPASAAAGHRNDGGAGRRHAEIREYLAAIDEPFREGHSVQGVTVAFYLPRRDVAITYDAHAYFALEDSPTYTVLCEHEMPGIALGRRLPFDVPEPGYDPAAATDPGSDPVEAAYAELGLSPSADESEVQSAYRERVKDVHPDQGGDEESFRRLREAYDTARSHCQSAS